MYIYIYITLFERSAENKNEIFNFVTRAKTKSIEKVEVYGSRSKYIVISCIWVVTALTIY